MLADQRRLARRLREIERAAAAGEVVAGRLTALTAEAGQAEARLARRRAQLPVPSFPDDLPVAAHRAEIRRALADHPVLVVCGETGSGKTTQLPKICLEAGRGVTGRIGHTQPRRIAARTVAGRIAQELQTGLGHAVGYQVRFHDRIGDDTYIKLMTDGILLAEIPRDPDLLQYDTLIIDEAHERSLNIDFLLGYLKRLLPRRPDLRVIITSATIDPQRLAAHFDGAPVIEVSGRTYPVELRYRPLAGDEEERDRTLEEAILQGVDEAAACGPGDILVFLPGEREIRDTAEALRKHHPPDAEILPLYARLSAAEQDRVFRPHSGRRIVLATNVAETSLTVPGIRYVVDPGLARISRYSVRTKVQQLHVEPISQAAAEQRAGRCGRVAPGVCIRLYAEADYGVRPRFTDPEITRTSLAAVILRMLDLGIGELERFPFVDPPELRQIRDGLQQLRELGAVDEYHRLTSRGRRMARLPVEPRISRMLLAADDERCLTETLIITAALSVHDPRERPLEAAAAADERHRRLQQEGSDFLGYLRLWGEFADQARHLSRAKLRAWCRDHFLSYMRLKEWQDVHQQLSALAQGLGLRVNADPAPPEAIHRALLAGLLGNIATKTESHEYLGARNTRVHLHPGSALFKKGPKWIMAAELVETVRLYARTAAPIDPLWVERFAGGLCKRTCLEPHWERRRAQVVAFEQVSLYGLVLVPRRKINYGPIDPATARAIFIRVALVGGDYDTDAAFFRHNRALIEEVEDLEHKQRRRDLLVDEEDLFRFYDQRIPEGIYDGAGFEHWRRAREAEDPRSLFLTKAQLMRREAAVTAVQFPETWVLNGVPLPLAYRFEPGHADDGVSLTVPLAALNQLDTARLEWLVPGLLPEKLTALIRALPKAVRRHFAPAPQFAQAALAALTPGEGELTRQLGEQLARMTGVAVPPQAWRLETLPAHLRMNIKVVDDHGQALAAGRDPDALRQHLGGEAQQSFRRLPGAAWEREGITTWDFGELPETVALGPGGGALRGYPALVDRGEAAALRVFDSPEAAAQALQGGLIRLLRLRLREPLKVLEKQLPGLKTLCLHYISVGRCEELREDLIATAVRDTFLAGRAPVRTPEEFERRLADGRGELVAAAHRLCAGVGAALAAYHEVQQRLAGESLPEPVHEDIASQLRHLVYPGFVYATPAVWRDHLPRYLKALALRLARRRQAPGKDDEKAAVVAPLWRAYLDRARAATGREEPELEKYRWLAEELRVSLFAQELKTALPVSPKRLHDQWQRVTGRAQG